MNKDIFTRKVFWLVCSLSFVLLGSGLLKLQGYAQGMSPQDALNRPIYITDGERLHYCSGMKPGEIGVTANIRFYPAYVAFSTGGSWVEAVSVDDFDGDGKADLVVSTSEYFDPERDNRIWVARQNSPTNFTLVYSSTVNMANPKSLDVADLNGDGYLDIVVANMGTATENGDVEIFWGQGNFKFVHTAHTAGKDPYAVAVMPVSTRALAIVTNWNDTFLSAFLGGSGYNVTRTDYTGYRAGWNQLAVGDLNSDGHWDVVAMWGQDYSVPAFTVYYGDGMGGLTKGPDFPKNNQNPLAIGVGDVTNDGRDDVIIARGGNRPYSEVLVYAQDANGELSFAARYPSYDIPESLDVADVNCDGINDLIATNSGWYAFTWWPGRPDGTLGPYQIESLPFYFSHIGPNGAEMADINGDGLKDYVVVDYNSKGVLVALQRPCYQYKVYLPLISKQQ